MKIGQMAKYCNVSKDTIQYYSKIGLLLPALQGGNYDFTDREIQDLLYIQKLKSMRFSLKEIQSVVQMRRLYSQNEPDFQRDYLNLLQQQCERINIEIAELEMANKQIQEESGMIQEHNGHRVRLGVPIQVLEYLECPHCSGALSLTEAEVSYPYVFEGKICCSCGYHIQITNGILDTGIRYTGTYDQPDLEQKLYKGLPDDFYKFFHKGADKCVSRMNRMDLKGKLVMENHINGYFFLYNHFQYLKNDCIYIITDKYLETLQMYKERIERLGLNLNILFIADAGMEYPLKKECIHLLVSFFSDGEHQLYFKDPLVVDTACYLAPEVQILGTSILFGNNSPSFRALQKKYPEGSAGAFREDLVKEYYRKCGYRLQWETLGTLNQTPNQFSFECHVNGEPLTLASYIATKH